MILKSEEETKIFAEKIANNILKKTITICLNGDLGSGKTTFSRYLINALQKNKKRIDIPSPTFTLLQTYEYKFGEIYHYDFYRLVSVNELRELNFSESVQDNICLIEWSNKFKEALPRNRVEIFFKVTSEYCRKLEFNLLGDFKKEKFL